MKAMWNKGDKNLNDNLKSLSNVIEIIRTFNNDKSASSQNDNFKVVIVDSYGHEAPLNSIEVNFEKQKIYINKEQK